MSDITGEAAQTPKNGRIWQNILEYSGGHEQSKIDKISPTCRDVLLTFYVCLFVIFLTTLKA